MGAQQRPSLGQVGGVRYAGNDFMKDVFALNNGEFGVAFDEPRKTAYLVYLKDEVEPLDTLRSIYARTGLTFDTQMVQRVDMSTHFSQWRVDFLESQQLEWLRQPR